jgi:hypothetical protein
VWTGSDEEVAECLDIAAALADDPDPVVHKPVCIFLKYAGRRDRARLLGFLDAHADRMPRPAVRLATEKLDEAVRGYY